MKMVWLETAAIVKGVVDNFFMMNPPSKDFKTKPLLTGSARC